MNKLDILGKSLWWSVLVESMIPALIMHHETAWKTVMGHINKLSTTKLISLICYDSPFGGVYLMEAWSVIPSNETRSVKIVGWLVGWFCCFTSQVNSYGHCGTVSSPNHTFSWAGLNKWLTSNLCTYFRL